MFAFDNFSGDFPGDALDGSFQSPDAGVVAQRPDNFGPDRLVDGKVVS